MAYSKMLCGAVLVAAAFGLSACGGEAAGDEAAVASGPEPEAIGERQATFKAIGKSFKAIRGQLEGESPEMAAIVTAATDMNASAQKLESLFPEGTSVADGYDTEALAVIWEKPDQFAEAHQRLVDASAKMITIAEGGDVQAVKDHVSAVGGSCKNCHDNFRLDTD